MHGLRPQTGHTHREGSGRQTRTNLADRAEGRDNWGHEAQTVTSNFAIRIHAMLERHLPEQRLFLKSDDGTRFIRLRPGTQVALIGGLGLFVGWTIIVTSIFLIDTISAGNAREQAQIEETRIQERLTELELARDGHAADARAAQDRFALAMDQVSEMQTRLLDSEERRRELERAIEGAQLSLRDMREARDAARMELAALKSELQAETGSTQTAAAREAELARTLAFLSEQLEATATERDESRAEMAAALLTVEELNFAAALATERQERVFRQIEDAVAMSMEPLDEMFRAAGLATEQIIGQVRSTYSGQGGPLMPITMSSRGEEPDAMSMRANEVLAALDELNLHRIAAEQLPFSMPVRSNFRLTSGFGYRTDPIHGGRRFHSGTDFAGPRGTPILSTGDGTVVFTGRQSGYGLMVEIRHPFGMTTRYAHLSRIHVSEGERVSRGDLIGDMGNTGRSTGTHLHYEVRRNGDPVNPMTFITAGRDVF
jgi:murein DD-endopeptidase MepM/ murein hydrolase activator NlpD